MTKKTFCFVEETLSKITVLCLLWQNQNKYNWNEKQSAAAISADCSHLFRVFCHSKHKSNALLSFNISFFFSVSLFINHSRIKETLSPCIKSSPPIIVIIGLEGETKQNRPNKKKKKKTTCKPLFHCAK